MVFVETASERQVTQGYWPHRAAIVAASIGLSCGGASFPRETVANNSRADDTWLQGEGCAGAAHDDDPGLRTQVLEAGSGRVVGVGESVRIHYVAQLPNGTVLHDTRKDGPPVEIMIGSTKVICGVERALLGMRAGEQRRVAVPWRMAFGESGRPPDVLPQTDLVFVIDLFLPADPVVTGGSPPAPPGAPPRGGGGGGRGR